MATTLIPTASRLRRGLRAVAELAATPLAPADYLDVIDPLRSRTDLRARIVSILPETRDAATIVLRPGRTWRGHVPGQHVRLGVDVDGVRHWRTYSLTSVPQRGDGCITITVKAVPDGTVSRHLVRRARPGDLVHLGQAEGEFTLPAAAPRRSLFVIAGSGVTPVMGMLRSRLEDLEDVVVVHCAPREDAAIFRAELRRWAADGRIQLTERFSERDGRLDVSELDGLVPDLHERQTWACGPGSLLDELEARWQRAGRTGQLHVERFRPALIEAGDGGTVAFTRTDRTVDVDGSTSLLDAGEDAGVLMPSGCRMGICFGCVVPLRNGAVRDLRTGEVTEATPGDGITVQTCISTAASACELDV